MFISKNKHSYAKSKPNKPWLIHGAHALMISALAFGSAHADQKNLEIALNAGERKLEFDWPAVSFGTAEYPAGPTGVTVMKLANKGYVSVDVRGGGPGTVNAAYMDLGYDMAELDTVVLSGGSWYGLEATTAVATAMKDDGSADGNAFSNPMTMAMSVGSIIFDFGSRRLNEIYPDKRLAQAAYRAVNTGSVPIGAHGGGRIAVTGAFFGCNAKSGQGAAFKQVGDLKVLALTVVNALGIVTDRDGNVVACHKGKAWPTNLKTKDLMQHFPESRNPEWTGPDGKTPENDAAIESSTKNTTISMVIINQHLDPAELKRLAAQVHTSMARGIQPFATIYDGDVLYAVSTAEITEPTMPSIDVGTIASDVMWDAILASVPEQPQHAVAAPSLKLSKTKLKAFEGTYKFSQFVSVDIKAKNGALYAKATGQRPAFAIGKGNMDAETHLVPVSDTEFMVPNRYPLTAKFEKDGTLVLNPGHWQQTGTRIVN